MTAEASKYVPDESPVARTTTDQVQAESVPSETSVSIVAAPWRAFSNAARWNSKPLQNTAGVASASDTHSQPGKRTGGAIASATSGNRARSRRAGARAALPSAWACVPAPAGSAW